MSSPTRASQIYSRNLDGWINDEPGEFFLGKNVEALMYHYDIMMRIIRDNKVRIMEYLIVDAGMDPLRPTLKNGREHGSFLEQTVLFGSERFRGALYNAIDKRKFMFILAKESSRTMGDGRLNDNQIWRLVRKYAEF